MIKSTFSTIYKMLKSDKVSQTTVSAVVLVTTIVIALIALLEEITRVVVALR